MLLKSFSPIVDRCVTEVSELSNSLVSSSLYIFFTGFILCVGGIGILWNMVFRK